MAQTPAPSQVIPREILPPARPPIAVQAPDGPVAEVPPPAGRDVVFTAGQMTIDGAITDMARANDALLGKTSNRRLTIGELFAAARELEQAYVRAGYILVRVTLPRQRFTDGDGVRVLVTDGTIAAIDVDNVPPGARPAVLARTQTLIGARHLTLAKIERQLLLLNTIPGLRLRSALAPGKDAGTVRLVLDGKLQRISSRLAADNRLPGSLGRWQLTGSSALNGAIGLGEQVYLTAGSQVTQGGIATVDNPLMTFGGGISLPVGNRGLTYQIAASGLASGNYLITYLAGELIIMPLNLQILPSLYLQQPATPVLQKGDSEIDLSTHAVREVCGVAAATGTGLPPLSSCQAN